MDQFSKIEISAMPLSSSHFRNKVEEFLHSCGLRMEEMDSWYAATVDDGDILLGGAGIKGNTIKCVAVKEELRGEGLLPRLISHIISLHPGENLRVFTKPEYQSFFADLGFKLLAKAPEAILMENGRGLTIETQPKTEGKAGVIVMNANPFTKGHKYLIDKALEQVDRLYIIPVKEDVSLFPYTERKAMIEAAVEGNTRVTVLPGSDYTISALTFPTYFLKDLSTAAETQMRLDLDLFARHFVPALKVDVRFVGTEPEDRLTARYNTLMKEILPIDIQEIPRLEGVSASKVRKALESGNYGEAASLTPETTHPFLLADMAVRALKAELDTPCKPGLVGPDGTGSHKDMDYDTMLKGIKAIRPYFPKIALCTSPEQLSEIGIEAERAMLAATGGVNTHRGAIFSLGLMCVAQMLVTEPVADLPLVKNNQGKERISLIISELATTLKQPAGTHGAAAGDVKGALKMARGGYRELFAEWLPYYRSLEGDPFRMQKTLLKIMSGLDDTCVIHRAGADEAEMIKLEAARLLQTFSENGLQAFNVRLGTRGVSPGGSADMLALTVLADKLLTY